MEINKNLKSFDYIKDVSDHVRKVFNKAVFYFVFLQITGTGIVSKVWISFLETIF